MKVPDQVFDVLVVGGGINGAGIACDAAGRGLSVLLCEQGDLAQATSSASSKLIHGGLRYLEYYEFRLVREALAEREVMLAKAPHIIHPLRFILPLGDGMRPAWMVRLGLFLYDHLGRHPHLPNSVGVTLTADPVGAPLQGQLRKGFAYYDCWVDDARLVVLNAMSAAGDGAIILSRTKFLDARRTGSQQEAQREAQREAVWEARLADQGSGAIRTVRARTLVNAAGPWVDTVLQGILANVEDQGGERHRSESQGDAGQSGKHVSLVKGSHIVVPRLYDGDHAYILQNNDGRVVFVMPYEGAFSLIGTTEVIVEGDPCAATMDPEEASYLCAAVGRYFAKPVSPADAVWSFTGVRPLFGDDAENPSALTRDYALEIDTGERDAGEIDTGERDTGAPLLSVFGGKITTYRCLAEQVMEKLHPFLPGMGPSWTAGTPLPGGAFGDGGFDNFVAGLITKHGGLDPEYLRALARRHGTKCAAVLGEVKTANELGPEFGAGLYGCEVDYLMHHEWAHTADDILWRRTKCGLHIDQVTRLAVATYMATKDAAEIQSENTQGS